MIMRKGEAGGKACSTEEGVRRTDHEEGAGSTEEGVRQHLRKGDAALRKG